jgi:glycosyl transferase family 25
MMLFIVNLDRQPERLQRMAEIFGQFGLQFTRIPAVDGDQS